MSKRDIPEQSTQMTLDKIYFIFHRLLTSLVKILSWNIWQNQLICINQPHTTVKHATV